MPNKKINCIILHGCCSEEEAKGPKPEYNKHWMPWTQSELQTRGIKTAIPLMPMPWAPDYDDYKREFEKYDIDKNSVIVAHSCACAFIVRWLGETKKYIHKLILVAPWKIPDKSDETEKRFYTYDIDKTIKERVNEIYMFTSNDEEAEGKESVKIFRKALEGKIINLENHGHYTLNDMKTKEFPELLQVILS